MRRFRAACVVVALFVLVPSVAFAQASITGVVKDSSGGVLPGVTVEASSPVLIEKVRSAVTDSNGQYRITELRAGTYSVTFSLTGFSVVKRDGIELQGTFVASVNTELKVGGLQETITVSGETPIVDVQSVRRQTVIDNELINAIPAARSYAGLMQLMPNTTYAAGASSDVQVAPGMVVFGSAGGRANEGRLQLNGLSVGSAFNGAGVSGYIADVGNAQEVVMTTSGGLGEAEVGGPSLNIVPKEGGNRFSGQIYASGVNESMIGTNHEDVDVSRGQATGSAAEIAARRFATPGAYTKVFDVTGGVGGPIARDRVWFFAQSRREGYQKTVPGIFANKNAGDPTQWLYSPLDGIANPQRQPAAIASSFQTVALRLTAQAWTKHKFTAFWDEQTPCDGAALTQDAKACRHSPEDGSYIIAGGASPTVSPGITALGATAPESAAYRDYGQRVQQAGWTAPISNRLLLEAGYGTYRSALWGGKPLPGANFQDLIRVTEQCGARGCAANGNIPNLSYRSPLTFNNLQMSVNWRAAASYVTGSQSLKFGYMGSHLADNRMNVSNSQFLNYRTNNGIPDQITERIDNVPTKQRVRTHSVYAQDALTFGRVTLQGALRYDHAASYYPEVTLGPVRFLPNPVHFDRTVGVEGYNDITPRGGVAIDLFGTGKTSLKVNVGRYLEAAQNGPPFSSKNPTARLSTSTTRAWTDADADWVADCDLSNPNAQGPTTAVYGAGGQDWCDKNLSANFGTILPESNLDPAILSGWGVRAGDWQIGAAVQHQIVPRVSVEVGYQRRWLVNFFATDNVNVAASEYTFFDVIVPADPRLPNSAGYTVHGVANVTPAGASAINNSVTTTSDQFGDHTLTSNAFNVNVTARPKFGLVVQGGFNTAKTHEDLCDLKQTIPELTILGGISPANPWCDTSTAWITRFTGLGTYTIPKIDVLVASTFRSDQGPDLQANWAVAPGNTTLGRNFATGQTITVNIIEPGTFYGDRINQVDFAISKLLRFGTTKTKLGLDVYNIMNVNPVLSYDQNINFAAGASNLWLRPSTVLQPRFFKVSAQFNF